MAPISRSPPEGPTRGQAGDDCHASEPEQGAADDRRYQTRRRHFGGSGAALPLGTMMNCGGGWVTERAAVMLFAMAEV